MYIYIYIYVHVYYIYPDELELLRLAARLRQGLARGADAGRLNNCSKRCGMGGNSLYPFFISGLVWGKTYFTQK